MTQQYLGDVHDKVYSALSAQLQLIHNKLPDGQGFEGVLVLRLDEEGHVLQATTIPKHERMSEATMPIEKVASRLKFDHVSSVPSVRCTSLLLWRLGNGNTRTQKKLPTLFGAKPGTTLAACHSLLIESQTEFDTWEE